MRFGGTPKRYPFVGAFTTEYVSEVPPWALPVGRIDCWPPSARVTDCELAVGAALKVLKVITLGDQTVLEPSAVTA